MNYKPKKKYIIVSVIGIFIFITLLLVYRYQQPYYKKYHYIAHALGGIDDKAYTNSMEAMEYSYSKGFRVLEVDLSFTKDKRLVARHEWSDDLGDNFSDENIPTYEEFMETKVYGTYTPVGIEEIIQFAMEHPDVYFVTDTKEYETGIYDMLQVIEDTSKSLGYTQASRQFVIQFYTYENYEEIQKSFDFKNYIFTLYNIKSELKENGIDNILEWCLENNIKVVTLPKAYATKENVSKLEKSGITTYTHTVDSLSRWKKLQEAGVSGVYTNFINPIKQYIKGTIKISAILGAVIIFVLTIFLIKIKLKKRKSE
ncbi:glycerophosphodiester phosphodiesterase family protein [Konateibacter massiliensis]|uniref:glycerophosphodiester phosphodiesterase family protein n=1 Tax=Konateibacter massiliensis TaxID=2002841 RepID=UPI000C16044E|nr:glycerophosphodiester phosphodiesterase family protein [Konateibacter massiliensis]